MRRCRVWWVGLGLWVVPLWAQPAKPAPPAAPPTSPPPTTPQPIVTDTALLNAVLHDHVGATVDLAALKADPRWAQWREQASRSEYPAVPEERKALALNVYLVHTLSMLAAHWPVKRLTDLEGFFDRETLPFAGVNFTLDDLEDKVLRPLADPRTSVALANGARGAPRLPTEAWSAAKIGEQLDAQAASFVNDPANVRVDAEQHILRLSLWFRWYAADFEQAGGPVGFIADHTTNAATVAWLKAGGYRIEWLPFDWTVGLRP